MAEHEGGGVPCTHQGMPCTVHAAADALEHIHVHVNVLNNSILQFRQHYNDRSIQMLSPEARPHAGSHFLLLPN